MVNYINQSNINRRSSMKQKNWALESHPRFKSNFFFFGNKKRSEIKKKTKSNVISEKIKKDTFLGQNDETELNWRKPFVNFLPTLARPMLS